MVFRPQKTKFQIKIVDNIKNCGGEAVKVQIHIPEEEMSEDIDTQDLAAESKRANMKMELDSVEKQIRLYERQETLESELSILDDTADRQGAAAHAGSESSSPGDGGALLRRMDSMRELEDVKSQLQSLHEKVAA